MSAGANRLQIAATLIARDTLRYSPAGVPIVNCRLAHRSNQLEAGAPRVVEAEIEAVAMGPVAQHLAAVAVGSELDVVGFLARKYRTGPALELHITNFVKD